MDVLSQFLNWRTTAEDSGSFIFDFGEETVSEESSGSAGLGYLRPKSFYGAFPLKVGQIRRPAQRLASGTSIIRLSDESSPQSVRAVHGLLGSGPERGKNFAQKELGPAPEARWIAIEVIKCRHDVGTADRSGGSTGISAAMLLSATRCR